MIHYYEVSECVFVFLFFHMFVELEAADEIGRRNDVSVRPGRELAVYVDGFCFCLNSRVK